MEEMRMAMQIKGGDQSFRGLAGDQTAERGHEVADTTVPTTERDTSSQIKDVQPSTYGTGSRKSRWSPTPRRSKAFDSRRGFLGLIGLTGKFLVPIVVAIFALGLFSTPAIANESSDESVSDSVIANETTDESVSDSVSNTWESSGEEPTSTQNNPNAVCDGDPTGHSDTGHGANQGGAYDNTCPEERPGNGTENNNSNEPDAGAVGQADDKNPPGQAPDGTDHNNGYECDNNEGVAQTNPPHTGCLATASDPPVDNDGDPVDDGDDTDNDGDPADDGDNTDAASITVSIDCMTFTAGSSKDISNIVVQLADGSIVRFEGLSGTSYSKTFDQNISTVWVKSGSNHSGDGSGYGERFDATECNTDNDGDPADDGDDDDADDDDADDDGDPADDAASITVSIDCMTFTATSSKDISNIVVQLADGSIVRFDGLSGHTFSKTFNQNISTVWVKSGSNHSGDGSGYGERFDTMVNDCAVPDNDGDPADDGDDDDADNDGDPADDGDVSNDGVLDENVPGPVVPTEVPTNPLLALVANAGVLVDPQVLPANAAIVRGNRLNTRQTRVMGLRIDRDANPSAVQVLGVKIVRGEPMPLTGMDLKTQLILAMTLLLSGALLIKRSRSQIRS
ncbi:MAG TPA: hypothetical protein VND22_00910 [Actinomycetota bacterium]|nr:hypothetical protein [Actinomycetota bacterium]